MIVRIVVLDTFNALFIPATPPKIYFNNGSFIGHFGWSPIRICQAIIDFEGRLCHEESLKKL
jgi:hypothetical protein